MQKEHTLVLLDKALNIAKSLFLSGHNNNYIEFHLADKKYPDHIINKVLIEINLLRKTKKRQTGIRKIISGATIITVACLITYFSFHSNSLLGIFLSGTGIVGVVVLVKGIFEFFNFE